MSVYHMAVDTIFICASECQFTCMQQTVEVSHDNQHYAQRKTLYDMFLRAWS